MPEFETGNPGLDMVLEAGPRVFNPLFATEDVRKEIAKSPVLHWYKVHLAAQARAERARLKAEIRQIGKENRQIEWKASDALGVPHCRLPLGAIELGKQLIGENWWLNEKELDSFLEAYPECRINVKRGTRGQQYVNGR
jgi:hypothetical protein